MFQKNVPLKTLTTLKVGGPAAFFVTVPDENALIDALKTAAEQKLRTRILGGGSNILASDEGFDGLVIKNEITGWTEVVAGDTVAITVGSGEVLDGVVERAVKKKYWGLENLSHIPGSVGATPIQNVGAYGVEVKDLITHVRAVHSDTLEFRNFTNAACQFGYRDSFFKTEEGKKYIVVSVTYQLSVVPTPQIMYRDLALRFADDVHGDIAAIREAVIEIRSQKFPDWHTVGTAGSFFKNPIIPNEAYAILKGKYEGIPSFPVSSDTVKIPLGWILEHVCHMRGITRGQVGTYKGQALVLVHDGSATAKEVIAFADFVAAEVKEKTGIKVEWEVTRLE